MSTRGKTSIKLFNTLKSTRQFPNNQMIKYIHITLVSITTKMDRYGLTSGDIVSVRRWRLKNSIPHYSEIGYYWTMVIGCASSNL